MTEMSGSQGTAIGVFYRQRAVGGTAIGIPR